MKVGDYSLLELATCPTPKHHFQVERTIFGEIVVDSERKCKI
jgi:hypothetical protein